MDTSQPLLPDSPAIVLLVHEQMTEVAEVAIIHRLIATKVGLVKVIAGWSVCQQQRLTLMHSQDHSSGKISELSRSGWIARDSFQRIR